MVVRLSYALFCVIFLNFILLIHDPSALHNTLQLVFRIDLRFSGKRLLLNKVFWYSIKYTLDTTIWRGYYGSL